MAFQISGSYCSLRFLQPELDFIHLYQNLREPSLWKYFRFYASQNENLMLDYLIHLTNDHSTHYVICQKGKDEPLGFFSIVSNIRSPETLEICNVMFSKKLQKTRIATEAVFLLLSICFQDKNVFRVQWMADRGNQNSMRAAKRFGFLHKGFMYDNGVSYWYSNILEFQWSGISKQYEMWLQQSNFDENGLQKTKLMTRGERICYG